MLHSTPSCLDVMERALLAPVEQHGLHMRPGTTAVKKSPAPLS